MSKRKLPPMEQCGRPLRGPNVNGFGVGEWCPTQDGSGKPMAVAVSIETEIGDVVLRLKSPAAVDTMIQALLRHKRDVWPEAK